jgi:hypothetical protein
MLPTWCWSTGTQTKWVVFEVLFRASSWSVNKTLPSIVQRTARLSSCISGVRKWQRYGLLLPYSNHTFQHKHPIDNWQARQSRAGWGTCYRRCLGVQRFSLPHHGPNGFERIHRLTNVWDLSTPESCISGYILTLKVPFTTGVWQVGRAGRQ